MTFLGSLKRLIARRGRPSQIYSDNGRTFIGAARWLKQIRADERIQCYLADEEIHWKFNLRPAPWWGGQFERLIGLFKQSFYKTIGGWSSKSKHNLTAAPFLTSKMTSSSQCSLQRLSCSSEPTAYLNRSIGERKTWTCGNEPCTSSLVKTRYGNAGPVSTWLLFGSVIAVTEKASQHP